jgi:hypothetical protein
VRQRHTLLPLQRAQIEEDERLVAEDVLQRRRELG